MYKTASKMPIGEGYKQTVHTKRNAISKHGNVFNPMSSQRNEIN